MAQPPFAGSAGIAEYDFRHNNRIALGINDQMRTDNMVAQIVGKRLTYQTTRRRIGQTA